MEDMGKKCRRKGKGDKGTREKHKRKKGGEELRYKINQ
jgi:hypothetical protein